MGMMLNEVFGGQSIKLNLEGTTKEAVFTELAAIIAGTHPECNQSEMFASLWEREQKMSTGIASGVAIPHASCRGISNIAGAIGISRTGIDYGSLDNKPVHVVFMLATGEAGKENHLHILNRIFTLVQSEALALIRNAKTVQEIQRVLSRFC